MSSHATREENGTTITYLQGLPAAGFCKLPGTLVFADFGIMGETDHAEVGSVAYELRREAGAVIAGDTRDQDVAAEYVLYRDGKFLVRYPCAPDAYARMARHGCPYVYGATGDLKASLSR